MKKKHIMMLTPILLLAGAAIIVMSGNVRHAQPSRDNRLSSRSSSITTPPPGDHDQRLAERSRARTAGLHQELIKRYGESRTNLSKYVANNLIGLMDDAVQMAELMQSGALGKEFGGGLAVALGGLENDLKLTDAQKDQTKALLAERDKRRMDTAKATINQLKQDPTALMKLMLASDAVSRGDMQHDEYKRLQAESAEALKEVANPLDGGKMAATSPMHDAEFLTKFKTILDPSQNEALQASIDRTSGAPEASVSAPEGIANLPEMNLEKIDASVESARKITTGLKSMLDGFGGLKKLTPAEPPSSGH